VTAVIVFTGWGWLTYVVAGLSFLVSSALGDLPIDHMILNGLCWSVVGGVTQYYVARADPTGEWEPGPTTAWPAGRITAWDPPARPTTMPWDRGPATVRTTATTGAPKPATPAGTPRPHADIPRPRTASTGPRTITTTQARLTISAERLVVHRRTGRGDWTEHLNVEWSGVRELIFDTQSLDSVVSLFAVAHTGPRRYVVGLAAPERTGVVHVRRRGRRLHGGPPHDRPRPPRRPARRPRLLTRQESDEDGLADHGRVSSARRSSRRRRPRRRRSTR
jgi:hypothetical protein